MRELYLKCVYPLVPRILGLLDRNPSSPTYGCFDRAFWHYGTSDFPNARLQEGSLTLALLYCKKFPNNPYYRKKKLKLWAEAGMRFFSMIQNKGGSFNEEYPYEHAFVAAAFPVYAVSEAILTFRETGETLASEESIIESLLRAGDWMMTRADHTVTNHDAGAITALWNLYELTGNEKYASGAKEKLEELSRLQSTEGWFPEYGGADVGYHTLSIDYLAKYYKKSGDNMAYEVLSKGVEFLYFFMHPDGSLGGEHGSRNTTYLIPHGIEIMADKSPTALWISKKFIEALSKGDAVSPMSVDDRHTLYNVYTYLQAFDDYTEKKNIPSEFDAPFERFFKESGLLSKKTPGYHIIVNAHKGGVFKLFNRKGLIYSDCGFLGELTDGTQVSTQWLDGKTEVSYTGNQITISGFFHKIDYLRLSVPKNIVFRSALFLGGSWASSLIKNALRKMLVTSGNRLPITFKRSISFDGKITVTDEIHSEKKFKSLYAVDNFALTHCTSARFFGLQELNTEQHLTGNLADMMNRGGSVKIERIIDVGTGKTTTL